MLRSRGLNSSTPLIFTDPETSNGAGSCFLVADPLLFQKPSEQWDTEDVLRTAMDKDEQRSVLAVRGCNMPRARASTLWTTAETHHRDVHQDMTSASGRKQDALRRREECLGRETLRQRETAAQTHRTLMGDVSNWSEWIDSGKGGVCKAGRVRKAETVRGNRYRVVVFPQTTRSTIAPPSLGDTGSVTMQLVLAEISIQKVCL